MRHVSQALTAKLGDFITFQSTRDERDEIKQGLFRVRGFPCAIGCTDGTHIRITAPHENEPYFVNPKGHHSIDVQAIHIDIHTYFIDHSPLGLFRANETNNCNKLNRLRIPPGRRQTSWLYTSAGEELSQGLPGTNPASGQSGT